MKFEVHRLGSYPSEGKDLFYLYEDRWDDFGYKTTFHAYYYDRLGSRIELGSIQVGFKGMEEGKVIDKIPTSFEYLSNEFFSLGTSEEYYEKVSSLEDAIKERIYCSLNDMAYNLQILDLNKSERVFQNSLLRGRSIFSVRTQLSRISKGGVRLTSYNFKYNSPVPLNESSFSTISLNFSVTPDSNPPTNVHVLIGRNGTGKTRLIQNMIKTLQTNDSKYGYYEDNDNPSESGISLFANILCVAFSPFDDFSSVSENSDSILPFSYIGLDKKSTNLLYAIQEQFIVSFENCMIAPEKKNRWLKTIEILKSDPVFEESKVQIFVSEWFKDETKDKSQLRDSIKEIFATLSSGHKVTLLIITACVDKLEEKSIMFLDEPENHLHPPLLSAFIRALSYLLIDRNGVAIVSTHSPVVLQEVPSSCVWTLRRTNTILIAEKLDTETFGTSISSLTSGVFGLEVTESGFHRMISEVVFNNPSDDYDDIIEKFDDQLGNEAQYIIRSLIATREKRGRDN